jgi:hypothetical protein
MLEKAKKRKYFHGSCAAMVAMRRSGIRFKPFKIHRIGALSEFNAAQSLDYFYHQ